MHHLVAFLGLPPAVRHRICHEAGLVCDTDADLNGQPDMADSWPSLDDFQLSCDLLLICCTVYAEVSSIVYSTNRFFIRYRFSHPPTTAGSETAFRLLTNPANGAS